MKRSLVIVAAMLVCVGLTLGRNQIVQAADITISVIFSDAGGNANGLVTDFAVATGWTANVSDGMGGTIPNPLTRPQWSSERLKAHMRETIKAYRGHNDAEKTRTKTLTDTDALIIFK